MKPRLLDLFCGAGGAAMGYHRAGFEVVGVDHKPSLPNASSNLKKRLHDSGDFCMPKPRLLDLFCGAGGAAVGYARAGFDVVGVDHVLQPRYPFEFIQADALEYVSRHGRDFDAIHASPPCQRYSWASFTAKNRERHPDLVEPTRTRLQDLAVPWVIENVVPSPLSPYSITLCGLMFGLKVFRHRRFESSEWLWQPHHPAHRGKLIGKGGFCCVVGHGGGASGRMRTSFRREAEGFKDTKADWIAAMGIDWMTREGLAQAIPPAYAEFVGRQLLNAISA